LRGEESRILHRLDYRGLEMERRHVCVCGRLAEKPLPKDIDGLFVKGKAYEIVCEECFRRIKRLRSRFKPSFGGCVSVTIVYDPGPRIFIISAFNEYGDSAYLSEDMRETRSLVRSLWTGETVILEGDKVVGVV